MFGAGWNGYGMYETAVVLIKYKEIIVAATGMDGELACLVCEDFSRYGDVRWENMLAAW